MAEEVGQFLGNACQFKGQAWHRRFCIAVSLCYSTTAQFDYDAKLLNIITIVCDP
jgi:hypothetical protein